MWKQNKREKKYEIQPTEVKKIKHETEEKKK